MAEIQEAAIACQYCGHDLQDPTSAQLSAWKLSATGAMLLTLLSTCGIAVHVHNEFEAIRSLTFDLPLTFLFWWLVCTFLIWVWRVITAALHSTRRGQVAQWLKDLLS